MLACPHCRLPMEDAADLSGQLVACPQCRGQFVMPGYPTVAPRRRIRKRDDAGFLVAAGLSLLVPGLGQMVQGRPLVGFWFLVLALGTTALGLFLPLLWLASIGVWVWAVVDAAVNSRQ